MGGVCRAKRIPAMKTGRKPLTGNINGAKKTGRTDDNQKMHGHGFLPYGVAWL